MMAPLSLEERERLFHAHLARCEQCRRRPSQLCPIGHALFLATAIKDPPTFLNPEAKS